MARSNVIGSSGRTLAAFCILLVACDAFGAVKGLLVVSSAIASAYHEQANINLTGGKLTVFFENSHFADLPAHDRDTLAFSVARLAYSSYPARDSLETISVGFKSVKGAAGFTVSSTSVPYSWKVSELRTIADSLALPVVTP